MSAAAAASSSSSHRSSSSSNNRVWSFNHSSAAHASAQFCPDCSSILDLPDADLILRCPLCHYQMRFSGENSQYEKLSISVKYSSGGGGGSNLNNEEGGTGSQPQPTFTRAKVKERCPNCNNPEMSFYTMQMRSVDEGQTVFYDCPKCGHTFSTNT